VRREHRQLGLVRRVPHHRLQQKPVELRLGERIRSLVLDRVLRSEHRERRIERMRHAVDRHLSLGHCLEQRRLGLRGRAIDLVGEQDLREHGARVGTRSPPPDRAACSRRSRPTA
jgi:hypothetical protein